MKNLCLEGDGGGGGSGEMCYTMTRLGWENTKILPGNNEKIS